MGLSLMLSNTKVCSASVSFSTVDGNSSSPVVEEMRPTTTGMRRGSLESSGWPGVAGVCCFKVRVNFLAAAS